MPAQAYLLEPHTGRTAAQAPAGHPSWPVIVSPIPNIAEFSEGDDIGDHGFIAKVSGWDMCIVPEKHRAFLPTLQAVLDDQYASGNGTDRTFLVRPSRHTAAIGQPHQAHMPDWHDHRNEGAAMIYSAADLLGTQFKVGADATVVPRAKTAEEFYGNLERHQASAAPAGSIVRFRHDALHRSPSPEQEDERHRTFYVVVAYEKGIPPGRFSTMRALAAIANPVVSHNLAGCKGGMLDSWRENAQEYFARFAASVPVFSSNSAAALAVPTGAH